MAMRAPRIALIHATAVAIEPVQIAFASLWPEARTTNLLEDSLPADLAEAGELTDAITARFVALARYVHNAGADAVLFTCSAFGAAIEAASRAVPIPVLKPNEAMLEETLDAGQRIGLLATFAPSIASVCGELNALATARGIRIDIKTRTVAGALEALQSGRANEHDALIAEAAAELSSCDALTLAQFSMARAAASVAAAVPNAVVLTSPASAVNRLKKLLTGRASSIRL